MPVLIVEDDQGLALLIEEQLEECGYETVCVCSARDAIDWLSLNTPCLVILDYTLPDMNGQELLTLLAAKGESLPPFIVATGQGDERIAVRMMKLGARDYIVKDSFFLEMLPERIKKVARELENETLRRQAEDALYRRAQEFRALAEHAPDIVARFSRQLRYLYINPAITKETGIPREEYLGRTTAALIMPAEQVELWNSALQEIFQTGREKEIYHDTMTPSGRRYYHSRLVPEFAPDGAVETVLSISRDITAIKETAAALHRERDKMSRLHLRSLPEALPELPGLALAACYRPASELRGDYYNVIPLGRELLIYLVDPGEGSVDGVMESLHVRKTIEACLSARADNAILSPSVLLRHLKEQNLAQNAPGTGPCAVLIAVFDLAGTRGNKDGASNKIKICPDAAPFSPGSFCYASSTFSTPPLLITGEGEAVPLPVEDPPRPAGGAANAPPLYREHYQDLAPGDTFIFSTDGLFKHGPDRAAREQQFRELCRKHAHLPPELLSRAIAAALGLAAETALLPDDIAYLVVQVPVKEQRLSFEVESDFKLIQAAKEKVAAFLAPHYDPQSDLLDFHELIVNAIEHGNKLDGGKKVSVEIILTARYYKIVITDQGEGFNWRERINRELELDGQSGRGRGIILTRMLTSYIGYNERGNRATMINLLHPLPGEAVPQ